MSTFKNKRRYTENTILTHYLLCGARVLLHLHFMTIEYHTKSSRIGGQANNNSCKEEEIADEINVGLWFSRCWQSLKSSGYKK